MLDLVPHTLPFARLPMHNNVAKHLPVITCENKVIRLIQFAMDL